MSVTGIDLDAECRAERLASRGRNGARLRLSDVHGYCVTLEHENGVQTMGTRTLSHSMSGLVNAVSGAGQQVIAAAGVTGWVTDTPAAPELAFL